MIAALGVGCGDGAGGICGAACNSVGMAEIVTGWRFVMSRLNSTGSPSVSGLFVLACTTMTGGSSCENAAISNPNIAVNRHNKKRNLRCIFFMIKDLKSLQDF